MSRITTTNVWTKTKEVIESLGLKPDDIAVEGIGYNGYYKFVYRGDDYDGEFETLPEFIEFRGNSLKVWHWWPTAADGYRVVAAMKEDLKV